MPAPVTAVLWDIDGTLLTSGRVAAGAFLDAVAQVTGRRPDGRNLDLGGRIDPEIAVELLGAVDADEALVPEVLHRLRAIAGDRASDFHREVQTLPGVRGLLDRLLSSGVRQTVVTGNVETVGMLKLQAAGLIPPIDPALAGFGDSGTTRVEVAGVALDRLVRAGWVHSPEQCWIVGDTPRDLQCARALGLRCALVATGRHSAASLGRLGADIVLDDLLHTDALLDLWLLSATGGATSGN